MVNVDLLKAATILDAGLIIDDLEQDENSQNVDPDEDEEAAEQVQFEKGTTRIIIDMELAIKRAVEEALVASGGVWQLSAKTLQANIVVELEEDQKQTKVVGMEQQHLQQQLVAALNERVDCSLIGHFGCGSGGRLMMGIFDELGKEQ
ncbi:hypothetical protein GPALN_010151 [Globodera pallida]|nr:hypothetical protein GPALN_010151 [Globodera pallida]